MRPWRMPFLPVLFLFLVVDDVAAQPSYSEDFSNVVARDPVETTAEWNVVAGELRLPSFFVHGVASLDTPGSVQDVAVAGNILYLADDVEGLKVVDVSDPENPVLIGSLDTSQALGIFLDGDLVYLADSSAGLKIIDVTDPSNPVLLGSIDTPRFAWDVVVEGDTAYLANEFTGLLVFDVSNPTAPVQIGSYDTPNNARGVDVEGNVCYVADRSQGGLVVLDVSNPSNPTLLSNVLTGADLWAVQAAGDRLYLANTSAGLDIYDVSDPTNPTPVGNLDPGTCRDVVVEGTIAVMAGWNFVHVADVSDPTNPVLIDSYDNPGLNARLAVDGSIAYVATGVDVGVEVVRFRDTMPLPQERTFLDFSSAVLDVDVVANRAYLSLGSSGYAIVDVTNPLTPIPIVVGPTGGYVRDVAAAGDALFLAEDFAGVGILDIDDPAAPAFVSSTLLPGGASGLSVRGDLLFVASGFSGLVALDISNLASPVLLGTVDLPGFALEIEVEGDHAVVACGTGGLRIVNIVDPTQPVEVGSVDTGNITDFAIAGNQVYFVDTVLGLLIMDVTDPSAPFVPASPYVGNGFGVDVSGDRVFVVGDLLRVLDISDPWSPVQAGATFLPQAGARGLAVSGNHIFVADLDSGMRVYRAFDSDFLTSQNRAQSIPVYSGSQQIVRARLTTTESPLVTWSVTASPGLDWQGITANDGLWTRIQVPGSVPRWRSTLVVDTPGISPTVSDLTLEWLYESAALSSIEDVPDDQGGRVRLTAIRSGYDFADEPISPIAGYNVYRLVNDEMARLPEPENRVTADRRLETSGGAPAFVPVGAVLTTDGDVSLFRKGAFPPGTWALVGSSFATQSDSYLFELATERDSTAVDPGLSTFLVTAHTTTPSVWFASEVLSGYSVDNIAPGVPQNLAVAYFTGSGNSLSWSDSPEEDFQFYRVYRSTNPDFVPTPASLVHEGLAPGWTDPEFDGGAVHYKVTSLDHAGNESEPAAPGIVTAVEDPQTPTRFAIGQNWPNPFNPSTTIAYVVPTSGRVRIAIYDVSGRLVRTLIDGHQPAGQRVVHWDGRSNGGKNVASGAYYYRMIAPGFDETRKMVLLE